MLSPFITFEQAQNYLYALARNVAVPKFSADTDYIAKQSQFMKLLEHPELGLKVIHIAGTSGKGSTAIILADILLSQKFKVGSSISPHITSICERIQINGSPISKQKFLDYLNQILPAINQQIQQNQAPSYFETLTALQFYIFAKEKVDYAIVEVGLGGRLDATNIFVPNKLCILNSIGLDHTDILGNTLTVIASEKAGIIQEKNQVIALSQGLEINQVFISKAQEVQADLDFVIPDFCFENVKQYEGKTYFSYIDQDLLDRQIALGMLGKYQGANASLALRAAESLSDRDNWTVDWDRLKYQLQSSKMPGRFEIVELGSKVVVFDGAHNPQKIQAFVSSLIDYYPNSKFDFLLAFKKGKDTDQMIDQILKYKDKINKIILTKFDGLQDTQIESQDTADIEKYLIQSKFERFQKLDDLPSAYLLIQNDQNTIAVVTGSLYLISTIELLDQKASLDLN